MSLKEQLQSLFEPKEIKDAREIALRQDASTQERKVTADYLRGEISIDQYREICDRLYPLTKIDLRKLAQDLHYRG